MLFILAMRQSDYHSDSGALRVDCTVNLYGLEVCILRASDLLDYYFGECMFYQEVRQSLSFYRYLRGKGYIEAA